MKYWIHVVAVIIISYLLNFTGVWWMISLVALASAAILRLKPWMAGLFGFLAGLLLWGGMSFYFDIENQHILSGKMGELFGGIGPMALIGITALLGGIMAFLGSFVGASLRELQKKKLQKTINYLQISCLSIQLFLDTS